MIFSWVSVQRSRCYNHSTNIVALNDFATVVVNQGSLTGLLSASAMQTGGEVFGSTCGPGTIAGERDSATGALLALIRNSIRLFFLVILRLP